MHTSASPIFCMAVSKSNKKSYIFVPSQIINSISQSSLDSLLQPPKKKQTSFSKLRDFLSSRLFISLIFLLSFLWMLKMLFNFDPWMPFSQFPCFVSQESEAVIANGAPSSELKFAAKIAENGDESEFWKQPDGMGYRRCLDFSDRYRRERGEIVKDRAKYLIVVVAGGMNQQRNQIIDAVVIARILGAALVVPILQKNVIGADESEFGDIFDLDHFKSVLTNDVRIVSSLPSTHVTTRPVEQKRTPLHASPGWIRSHYHEKVKEGRCVASSRPVPISRSFVASYLWPPLLSTYSEKHLPFA